MPTSKLNVHPMSLNQVMKKKSLSLSVSSYLYNITYLMEDGQPCVDHLVLPVAKYVGDDITMNCYFYEIQVYLLIQIYDAGMFPMDEIL